MTSNSFNKTTKNREDRDKDEIARIPGLDKRVSQPGWMDSGLPHFLDSPSEWLGFIADEPSWHSVLDKIFCMESIADKKPLNAIGQDSRA